MIGHHLALFGAQHTALALNPGDNALHGGGEIVEADRVGATAGGHNGRFVDQVGQVGTGESRGDVGDSLFIEAGCHGDLLQVDLEDRLAALAVRAIDQNLPVDTTGPEQGRVQYLRPVGRGQQHHAFTRVETVQFGQQLIEGLLLFRHCRRTRRRRAFCPGRRVRR